MQVIHMRVRDEHIAHLVRDPRGQPARLPNRQLIAATGGFAAAGRKLGGG